VVERYPDAVDVGGSIPPVPTMIKKPVWDKKISKRFEETEKASMTPGF
jgi:hypothetical protein